MIPPYHRKWSLARYVRWFAEVLGYISDAIRLLTAVCWAVTLIGIMSFVAILLFSVMHF